MPTILQTFSKSFSEMILHFWANFSIPKGRINDRLLSSQIMALRQQAAHYLCRSGLTLLMHIYVTRSQGDERETLLAIRFYESRECHMTHN